MKCMNTCQKNRYKPNTCNDTLWLCLFVIFWCILILIIAFAINYGNYPVAIKGADSFGNICGQKYNKHFENVSLSARDTSKKPYLFYFDIKDLDDVVKICVERCLRRSLRSTYHMFRYYEEFSSHVCIYNYNILRSSILELQHSLGRWGPCPVATLESIPYRNRCLNVGPQHLTKDSYALLNSGGSDQFFFMAVYLTWSYVAMLCGFALIISLLLLAMMFWLTKFIAWFIWFLAIIINAALCFIFWTQFNELPFEGDHLDSDESENSNDGKYVFKLFDEFRMNNFLIFCSAVLASSVTIILITFTFILFQQLNQLKLLFDEARICIKRLPGLIVALIIALLNIILLILLSGYTLLCITTAKDPVVRATKEINAMIPDLSDDNFKVLQQIEYMDVKPIRRTFWLYIVGFLWTTEFIFAFEEFFIGAVVAFWYFEFSDASPPQHAIRVLFKYHLGTIAKGSAVITLFKLPRLIITFICRSLKKGVNQRWFYRFQAIEECFGIFNHNAFVPAAFETTDFSSAAAVAWKIFNKNAIQIESINNIFDFVMFLSKLCVAALTCLVGVILLKDEKEKLLLFMAPVLFSTFCAFCIAHIVFSIFEMTIDSLLLCVCEDQVMYGGMKRLTMNRNTVKLFRKNGENPAQVIKIKTIYRQPFRSTDMDRAVLTSSNVQEPSITKKTLNYISKEEIQESLPPIGITKARFQEND